jgi:predicted SAM-dependent methyltransferase
MFNKFSSENIEFKCTYIDKGFDVGKPVDKIYCLEFIEHIYYEQSLEMLRLFHSIMKPGGEIFITTPNYQSFWPIIEWTMDKFHLAPKMDKDQHVQHLSKKKLKQLFNDACFKIKYLKTTCFMAPWVAPISWKFATAIDSLESKLPLLPGNIIIGVAERI